MNQENTKRCPQCAEVIKAEAVKCRYCGSDCRSDETTAGKPQPAAKRKSPWKLGCLVVAGVVALLLILFMLADGGPAIDCSSQEAFRESSEEVAECIANYEGGFDGFEKRKYNETLTEDNKARIRAIMGLRDLINYARNEEAVQDLDSLTPEEVIKYFNGHS